MKYSILILFLCIQCKSYCQDTYTRVIDHSETRRGNQIVRYENRTFIQSGGIYNNQHEGVVVMEIDDKSNVIWEKHLPWIDVTSGSMIIRDDIITLSGNHNPEQIEFYLHQMSIDGGDSITTYIIDDFTIELDRMFQLSTIHYNGKFLVGGTGNIANTTLDNSIIYVVDELSGTIDTLLMIDQQTRNSSIWQLREDLDGNIVAFIKQDTQGGYDFRSIIKLDSDFKIIWKYTSEEDIFNNSVPKGCILDDKKVAFVTGSTGGESQTHAIRVINQDSSIAWQFDWPDINSYQRELLNLELAADGSLFVTGLYGYTNQIIPIRDVPFIAKISASGSLIWERAFVQFDDNGNLKRGLLYDVEELEDGSLIVIGQQNNENGDILIMKLTSEGCLEEDDCGIQNVYTDISDITIEESRVNVFPNPTKKNIHIDTDMEFIVIKLYDAKGNLVHTYKYTVDIDLSHLPKGNYYMKFITKEGKAAIKQLVKL